MGRRILVTGAGGFIGRTALPALVSRGFEVVALTRSVDPAAVSGVEFVRCDLSDAAATTAAIGNAEASDLLHLAWHSSAGDLWQAPENLEWLKISLELARAFVASGGKRITVSGSCGEYDWQGGLCREGATPLNPATFYGSCKLALYHALSGYCANSDVQLAWGRAFFVYGPGEHPSRLGASVVNSLLQGEEAHCTHGMQLRDYLHVSDVGSAYAALADSDAVGDYNLASGQAIRLKDLILALAEAVGKPELVRLGTREAPPYEPPLIVADMEKTGRSGIDFTPAFSLDSGAADTVRWFRDSAS